MPCGCNKKRATVVHEPGDVTTASAGALSAASKVYHEVHVDGQYSGRKFTNLLAAEAYAKGRAVHGHGATIRTVS